MRSCLSRVGDMEVAVRESQSFQQRSLGAGWGLGGATLMNSGSRPAGEAPAGGAGWTRGSWKWSPCREVQAGRPRLSALGECEQAPPSPWGLWEAEPLSQRAPQVRGQGEAMSFLPPDLPLPPRHWPPVQPPPPPRHWLYIHLCSGHWSDPSCPGSWGPRSRRPQPWATEKAQENPQRSVSPGFFIQKRYATYLFGLRHSVFETLFRSHFA